MRWMEKREQERGKASQAYIKRLTTFMACSNVSSKVLIRPEAFRAVLMRASERFVFFCHVGPKMRVQMGITAITLIAMRADEGSLFQGISSTQCSKGQAYFASVNALVLFQASRLSVRLVAALVCASIALL